MTEDCLHLFLHRNKLARLHGRATSTNVMHVKLPGSHGLEPWDEKASFGDDDHRYHPLRTYQDPRD